MAVRIEPDRVAPVSVPIPTPRPFMPQGPSVGLDPATVPDPKEVAASLTDPAGAGGKTGAPSDPAVPDFSGEATDEDAALWVGISAGMQAKTDTDDPLYNGLLGFIEAKKARDSFMSQARDKAREREMEDEERQWRREDRGIAAEDRARARKFQDSAEARAEARFGIETRTGELEYLSAANKLEQEINGGAPIDGDRIVKTQTGLEKAIEIAKALFAEDVITEEEYNSRMQSIADQARALDEAILRRQTRAGGAAPELGGGEPGAEPTVPDPAAVPPADEGSGILGVLGAAKQGVSDFFAPGGTLDTYNAGHAEAGTPNPFRGGTDVVNSAIAGEPMVPDRADSLDTYLNPDAPPMPREDRAPAPAEQQPSDVFPPEGEIVGDGSLQNPKVAPDMDAEQVKQWARLYLQPGDFFEWRGGKYRMK